MKNLGIFFKQVCNDIFSPLFLFTYGANIGYLLARLSLGIGTGINSSYFIEQVETVYALLLLIFVKILLPTYFGAILHDRVYNIYSHAHNTMRFGKGIL